MYVVYILNISTNNSIGNISPHQYLYGQTPNISPALCFQFYEAVYDLDTNSFPDSTEKKGRWVGFAPNVGGILIAHFYNKRVDKWATTLLNSR